MKRYSFILALVVAAVLSGCGGGVSPEVKLAAKGPNGAVATATDNMQVSPAGVTVYGKFKIEGVQLDLIDAGIADATKDAAASGYTVLPAGTFYDIFTPPYQCQPSPSQHVPSFLVHADNYDGSEFDQYNSKGAGVKDGVGVIYAAELVISIGTPGSQPPRGQMYVCPDASVLREAVRNGAEHMIIANNDNEYFWLTVYHGNGFYHHLLPKRAAPLSALPPSPAAAGSGNGNPAGVRAIEAVR